MANSKLQDIARSLVNAKIGSLTTVNTLPNRPISLEVCRMKGVKCLSVTNANHPELSFYIKLSTGTILEDSTAHPNRKRPNLESRRLESFKKIAINSDLPRKEILSSLINQVKTKRLAGISGIVKKSVAKSQNMGIRPLSKEDEQIWKARIKRRSDSMERLRSNKVYADKIPYITPPDSRPTTPPNRENSANNKTLRVENMLSQDIIEAQIKAIQRIRKYKEEIRRKADSRGPAPLHPSKQFQPLPSRRKTKEDTYVSQRIKPLGRSLRKGAITGDFFGNQTRNY